VVILISYTYEARATEVIKPIRLHPENPHYFEWRGKPTILITSGEHYGAVLNQDFDYKRYLNTLANCGFNLTRVFSGSYCEPPGAFGIANNTLAPAEGKLLCPWARSDPPRRTNGGNKFDLNRWDRAYFDRLRDFVTEAAKRGVVVEVVFFCTFYDDSMWKLSPVNAGNNVNGIGNARRQDVFTLKDEKLTMVQGAMVRKIVEELNEFDNVYYEICNEPYERGGQTQAWQNRVAETIVKAEAKLPHKHLIAQNLPWRPGNVPKGLKSRIMPSSRVSILNFHGASPPTPVSRYYGLNKVIAYDETGGRSSDPEPYRVGGWDFIIAGGGVYNNLDFSFAVGHEDGSAKVSAPGGGGAELRNQLAILRDFINSFDFVKMKPDNSVIQAGPTEEVTARALVQEGRAYAIYVNGGTQINLTVKLSRGAYVAQWVNTRTGNVDRGIRFRHSGGNRMLRSPGYDRDIALRIVESQLDEQ